MGAYRHLLIDDQGQAWPPGSMQLRAANFAADADFDFVDYALRNLGFIEIIRTEDRARLRLRPRVVAEAALVGAFHLLGDEPPGRAALSWLSSSWNDEIFGDWKRLTHRLIDLVNRAKADASNTFLLRSRDLEHLAKNDSLAEAARWWHSTNGRIDGKILEHALREKFTSRYMVTDVRGSGTFIVAAVGNGYVTLDDNYRKAAVGGRFEDQVDFAYGKWVAQTYRETLARGGPRVDDVDVMVRGRTGRSRVRYRRVILPFCVDRNVMRLVSMSVVDPAIDLRVEV